MSSGEADGVKTYDVSVVHTPQANTNRRDLTASLSTTNNTANSSANIGSITWGDNTTYTLPYSPNTTSYTYWYGPRTVYMYQIRCPRCRKMNWCELDNVTSCKKCSAQLRAVSKRVDYDVAIDT